MFGKVKDWLGIEGIKIELILPEDARINDGVIEGKIHFMSMRPQTITGLRLKLIERYTRGTGEDQLIDEYTLGEKEFPVEIHVPEREVVETSFELPYNLLKSDMDKLEGSNIFGRGLARLAKYMNKVESDYRVEVEARVKGTAVPPFDRQTLIFAK